MKKRTILLGLIAAVVLLVQGCAKEHQCKCTATDVQNDLLKVLTVDKGMKCESVTEMGFEVKEVTTDGVHSLRRTEMHPVKCREYAD